MRRRTMLAALGAGTGAVILGTGRPAQAAESLAADDLAAIRGIVRSYFQKRADGITAAGRRIPAETWRAAGTVVFADKLENEVPSLFGGRDLAARAHGGYARAETSVRLSVRTATAAEVTAGVEEITTLFFAGRHPVGKPASVYRLDHSVRLVRASANRWVLAEAVVDSDGALPPLTQPHLDRAGRRTAATAGVGVLGPASATDRDAARATKPPARLLADRYFHGDMIRYASAWALSRNPAFPDYHSHGGDCTSFVSQIMWAGGWETVGPPGQSTRSKWFAGPTVDDCSFTWGGANNFHSFAITYSQRFTVKSNVYHCQDSDVVQYDWTSDNNIDHTQFVSDNVYDERTVELYMTQHDNDYINRPISEILADLNQHYPNFKTYGMSHTVW